MSEMTACLSSIYLWIAFIYSSFSRVAPAYSPTNLLSRSPVYFMSIFTSPLTIRFRTCFDAYDDIHNYYCYCYCCERDTNWVGCYAIYYDTTPPSTFSATIELLLFETAPAVNSSCSKFPTARIFSDLKRSNETTSWISLQLKNNSDD